jgi:hypothetical protein
MNIEQQAPRRFAIAILSCSDAAVIVGHLRSPLPATTYKRRLGRLRCLSHVAIEVETCPQHG